MSADFEQFARDVISGSRNDWAARILRVGLACAEPFYAGTTLLRNRLFDAGICKAHRLGRPVISVGNLTTGGTGKTPMVRWLASYLRDAGLHVAVLSRGYKSAGGAMGDEQVMLDRMLNGPSRRPVLLKANPSRRIAAEGALGDQPLTNVFVLDDGFQHRAVARDLDIVLLNATDPFGAGHVLPRGFLREPRSGLRRAGAMVITHADRVTATQLVQIEKAIRAVNGTAPIYRAVHVPAGLRTGNVSSADPPDRAMDDLKAARFFAFGGIGSPHLLQAQLQEFGDSFVGAQWFPDHHHYSPSDLSDIRVNARAMRANLLVTTEKDWVKLNAMEASTPEIWRLDVALKFMGDHEQQLLAQIRRHLPA